jgi:hypothetical protein
MSSELLPEEVLEDLLGEEGFENRGHQGGGPRNPSTPD